MRVISGIYKGRKLKGYEISGTRPTLARVKESLFAMLNPYLSGSDVLDLFAGTGSLGIEALSNSAKTCYFSEKNKIMYNVLKDNLKDIKNASTINDDYLNVINKLIRQEKKFDLVFLDPPYNKGFYDGLLKKLDPILNSGAIIVCEFERDQFDNYFELIKEKKYGSKNIRILRK